MADVKCIMNKIREAIRPIYKEFVAKHIPPVTKDNNSAYVSYETMKKALIELLGNDITDHEIITICRHFSAEQEPLSICNRDAVKATAQLEMKRNLWNSFEQLKSHIFHLNPERKSYLKESTLRTVIRGCSLPFTPELIDDIFQVLIKNNEGEIEICDFLNFIDIGCNPSPEIPPMNIAFELCPKIPFLHKGRLVDHNCFLKYLDLEKDLSNDSELH